jgi:hypothetical protein
VTEAQAEAWLRQEPMIRAVIVALLALVACTRGERETLLNSIA